MQNARSGCALQVSSAARRFLSATYARPPALRFCDGGGVPHTRNAPRGPPASHTGNLAHGQLQSGRRRDSQRAFHRRRICAMHGERRIEVARPSDGVVYASVPLADAGMVDRAVENAWQAFKHSGWARMAPRERAKILRRFAELVEADAPALGRLEVARLDAPDRPGDRLGRAVHRRGHPLLRRVCRQAGRRRGGDRSRSSRHDDRRAVWRDRRNRTVEFPAGDGVVEDRARAGGGQCGGAEALGNDAVFGACGSPNWPCRRACRRASST